MGVNAPRDIIVHVELLGFLEHFATQTDLDFSIRAGSTLKELILSVADRLGSDFRRATLDKCGDLNGGVALILNREVIAAHKISEVRLWRESSLLLAPSMEGG